MLRLQCRGSIAWAAVVMALLAARPARAQIAVAPDTPRQRGGLVSGLITGVQYDVTNRVKAQQELDYRLAKLARDGERGNTAAVDRDRRRIDYLRYRIAVDCWLIRQNSLVDPGYYPVRTDPVSCAAIAQAASPPLVPYPPQTPTAGSK